MNDKVVHQGFQLRLMKKDMMTLVGERKKQQLIVKQKKQLLLPGFKPVLEWVGPVLLKAMVPAVIQSQRKKKKFVQEADQGVERKKIPKARNTDQGHVLALAVARDLANDTDIIPRSFTSRGKHLE